MMEQAISLSNRPHIIIATPGRLADHISSSPDICLDLVQSVVLDEADRLLEPCFEENLNSIFDAMPVQRQTLLFSATITDDMKRLQALRMKDAVVFEASSESQFDTQERLEQMYTFGPQGLKECFLVHILRKYCNVSDGSESDTSDEEAEPRQSRSVIVFVQSCKTAKVLTETLCHLEIQCVSLHSGLNQRRRLASLGKFRSSLVRILIATDVASRGLDIPAVDLVRAPVCIGRKLKGTVMLI